MEIKLYLLAWFSGFVTGALAGGYAGWSSHKEKQKEKIDGT